VGTDLIDMGGVLELYPINGKTIVAEKLTKKRFDTSVYTI